MPEAAGNFFSDIPLNPEVSLSASQLPIENLVQAVAGFSPDTPCILYASSEIGS